MYSDCKYKKVEQPP